MLRNLRLFGIFLLCAIFSACAGSSSPTPPQVGRIAPLVQLYDVDGEQFPLNSYRGKTVVLVFWAQWCSRSQAIIRELNTFARDNRNRAVVIGVNIDKADKLESLKNLITGAQLRSIKHSFSGNEIYDEAYVAFDVGEIPTVFVLNPDGLITAQGTSFDVIRDYFKLK